MMANDFFSWPCKCVLAIPLSLFSFSPKVLIFVINQVKFSFYERNYRS